MFSKLKNLGPGALIAAAFIGPGTVTACTLAGANYGYTLLWALLFATFATIILQEMSARLGLVTQQGLGDTLRSILCTSIWKWPFIVLVIVALYMGNAAYEAGNLSGAALGIEALVGQNPEVYRITLIAISVVAAFILWFGSYRALERILLCLVATMALAFIATFIAVGPDFTAMFKGLTSAKVPEGSLLTVIALIGTTVVPYNLFLHASAVKSKWHASTDLNNVRVDNATTIGLGGLITILIATTAAASMFGSGLKISGASDMAVQLEPLFGSFSKIMLGVGFFAAGLSSAITAPLATACATTEVLGVKGGTSSTVFKAISLSIVLVGSVLALTGAKPISIILAAQFANGLLLPIVAAFLLYVMNQKTLLGDYTNSWLGNTLGAAIIMFTTGLGIRMIMKATGLL